MKRKTYSVRWSGLRLGIWVRTRESFSNKRRALSRLKELQLLAKDSTMQMKNVSIWGI